MNVTSNSVQGIQYIYMLFCWFRSFTGGGRGVGMGFFPIKGGSKLCVNFASPAWVIAVSPAPLNALHMNNRFGTNQPPQWVFFRTQYLEARLVVMGQKVSQTFTVKNKKNRFKTHWPPWNWVFLFVSVVLLQIYGDSISFGTQTSSTLNIPFY